MGLCDYALFWCSPQPSVFNGNLVLGPIIKHGMAEFRIALFSSRESFYVVIINIGSMVAEDCVV